MKLTLQHQELFGPVLSQLTGSGNADTITVTIGTEVFETPTETYVSIRNPRQTRYVTFKRMPDGIRAATFQPRTGSVNSTTSTPTIQGNVESLNLPARTSIRYGKLSVNTLAITDRLTFVVDNVINVYLTSTQAEQAAETLALHADMVKTMFLRLALIHETAVRTIQARTLGGFLGAPGNTGPSTKRKSAKRYRIHGYTRAKRKG